MKKILITFLFLLTGLTRISGQTENYSSSSSFWDNWSIGAGLGLITRLDNVCEHTSPIFGVNADKFITPWIGLGVDLRFAKGFSEPELNPPTKIDAMNLGLYAKWNLVQFFAVNHYHRIVEPSLVMGLGWGHTNYRGAAFPWKVNGVNYGTSAGERNYLTYRAGLDLDFHLGPESAWAVTFKPAFVWGDIVNFKLNKHRGQFEFTLGALYHFKTSNKTHSYTRAYLHNPQEIDRLNDEINRLKKTKTVETKTIEVYKPVEQTYIVNFAKGSYEFDPSELSGIVAKTVDIKAYASPDGSHDYNIQLARKRAEAVEKYLTDQGISVRRVQALGATKNTSNRIVIVTVVEDNE